MAAAYVIVDDIGDSGKREENQFTISTPWNVSQFSKKSTNSLAETSRLYRARQRLRQPGLTYALPNTGL